LDEIETECEFVEESALEPVLAPDRLAFLAGTVLTLSSGRPEVHWRC